MNSSLSRFAPGNRRPVVTLFFLVALTLLYFLPGESWAGTTTAKIQSVLIYDGVSPGLVYVYPVGGVSNAPACHGSNGDYYSFAMNRPLAKEYYAMVLAAQATGATVKFYGTGACDDQWMSETLSYMRVESE